MAQRLTSPTAPVVPIRVRRPFSFAYTVWLALLFAGAGSYSLVHISCHCYGKAFFYGASAVFFAAILTGRSVKAWRHRR